MLRSGISTILWSSESLGPGCESDLIAEVARIL